MPNLSLRLLPLVLLLAAGCSDASSGGDTGGFSSVAPDEGDAGDPQDDPIGDDDDDDPTDLGDDDDDDDDEEGVGWEELPPVASIEDFGAYLQHELAFGDDNIAMREPVLAAMSLLDVRVDDVDAALAPFDDAIGGDGTFPGTDGAGTHYAIRSATFRMAYERLGRTAPEPLTVWLERNTTWEDIEAELAQYESESNFWGGVIGYVLLWTDGASAAPLWMDALVERAERNDPGWVDVGHQTARAIQALLAGDADLVRMDEVRTALLAGQQDDGGWSDGRRDESAVDETAQAIGLLAQCFEGDDVDEALFRGLTWLLERQTAGADGVGFAPELGAPADPDATLFGLSALVHAGVVEGDAGFLHPLGYTSRCRE